jgi:hypothetical protein
MNEADSLESWDLLKALGFQPDANVHSDVRPGLSYNFGNFKLSASAVTSMRSFSEVVLFTGVMASQRSISNVEFEMPRRIDSSEQCAAWIAWHLDQASEGREFLPTGDALWLQEGRRNRDLLPWVVNLEEFNKRPVCLVQRPWLRLALKELGKALATANADELVLFHFDGGVLTIRCAGEIIAVAAKGSPWGNDYAIPAKEMRRQPKRFMREILDVSVWQGRLSIGGYSYKGVLVIDPRDATRKISPDLSVGPCR